jgi:hypothetical protein
MPCQIDTKDAKRGVLLALTVIDGFDILSDTIFTLKEFVS